MSEQYVLINDVMMKSGKASLLVNDLAIQRGYGVFDFFKTLDGSPVYMDDHLDRFFRSAEGLRLPVGFGREALKDSIFRLMGKNNIPDSGIRLTLTGGYSEDGYALSRPNLVITQQALKPPPAGIYDRGIRLITHAHQRQLPHVKTIDYLMAIWLQPVIKSRDADDVLYHTGGIVTECPRSNFFVVTADDVIRTPASNVLAGITRQKLLALAGKRFTTQEADITLEDIRIAKEAFISSTTKYVVPVTAVDGRAVGDGRPGPVTKWLLEELRHKAQKKGL